MTWDEFWNSLSLVPVVGWVLGVAGLIGFAVKSWPWVKKFVGWVDALFSLPTFMTDVRTTLADQDAKIADIHHETHFNNGSSIKDATGRIEYGVGGLYRVLAKVVRNDPDLASELEDTMPKPGSKPR